MASIPPFKDHPLYEYWMAARTRFLKAAKKLDEISEGDPEFASVLSECDSARTAYDAILAKIA